MPIPLGKRDGKLGCAHLGCRCRASIVAFVCAFEKAEICSIENVNISKGNTATDDDSTNLHAAFI